MSTTLLAGVGLELITREASKILFSQINDAIDEQQEMWVALDIDFADLTGNAVGEIELEHILEGNFYEGHHPSFIESPPERYPNLSVMAYRARPAALPFADQHHTYDDRLMIETFVKAGPGAEDKSEDPEMETVLNRRAWRMAEAVVAVIEQNKTLNGSIAPMVTPPEVLIANVGTTRREEVGSGPRYLWQLARVEYVIQKHSELHT